MWLFTRDGYFSVVKDEFCGPDEVMVRARCRQDLESLLSRLGLDLEILTIKQADYRWRVKMPHEVFTEYVRMMAATLDYADFKSAAPAHDDFSRLRAYHKCWDALRQWQDKNEKNGGPEVKGKT